MIKKISYVFILSTILFSYQNCGSGFSTLRAPQSLSLGSEQDLNSLKAQVQALYDNQCAQCHSINSPRFGRLTGITNLDQIISKGFIVAGDPDSSLFFKRIADGTMPPNGGLSSNSVALVRSWIVAMGSSNNGGSNPAPTPGVEFPGATFQPVAKSYSCQSSDVSKSENFIRRLSKQELINSFEDIFGSQFMSSSQAQRALSVIQNEASGSVVSSFRNTFGNVETISSVADVLTSSYFATQNIQNILPGCNPSSSMAICKGQLKVLGKRILRRPLSAAESNSLDSMITALGNDQAALRMGLVRLFASPYFHQHMEDSDVFNASGAKVRLSQYEIASRLSYRLTGFPPDAALLQAADRGELSDISKVSIQAQRLIKTNRAKVHFADLVETWLNLEGQTDPDQVLASSLGLSSFGLGKEIRDEFEDFAEYTFANNGNFSDLYTDNTVFPTTSRLANLYQTPVSSSPVRTGSNHGGLFLRLAFLKSAQTKTSPINRGVNFRKRVMCGHLPSPDPTIIASRDDLHKSLSPKDYSNREIASAITSGASCVSCHSQINPVGFVLENFGGVGESRTAERVFDSNGNIIAMHAINTSVDDIQIPGRAPFSVSSATAFVRELASSESVMRCMSQQVFRHTRFRNAATSDGCVIENMTQALKQGKSVQEAFMLNAVNEDIFWRTVK